MTAIRKGVQILLALSVVEGIIAFIWLLAIPTSRQGYSVFRLATLAVILLSLIFFAASFVTLQKQKSTSFIEQIKNIENPMFLSFLFFVVSTVLGISILYKDQWLLLVSESTYTRLTPILAYGMFLCLQTAVFLLVITRSANALSDLNHLWKPTAVLLVLFLLVWLFISYSQLGFLFDNVGLSWGPPGPPISFAQVYLVLSFSFLIAFGWHLIQPRWDRVARFLFSIKDVILFLALWGLAVVIWSNQPASPTHFAPPPMPPNNEVYPNSDALIFDRSAYHLLYGVGFSNQLIRRPLYVGLLAVFHRIVGTGYESTVFLQILVLALIPSLVFVFTSKLSNRLAGLVASGLILLREKNAIELSGVIITSHAKLMMSDMISMLGVVLVLYTTIKLFSRENPHRLEYAIAGACLGLTALVRAQVLILVPLLILFIVFSRKPLKLAFQGSMLILLGLFLVMAPWVWRNWNLTGTFVLDDRGEERLLARNYSLTQGSLPLPLEGETDEEFSARLKTRITSFIFEHPDKVIFFVSNHLMRNLATSAVYTAPAYSADSPLSLTESLPFWDAWTGELPSGSRIALLVNLMLIAFGIVLAMAKNRWAGLFPLIVLLFYSFGNALVRSSGWRFNQPADWIILSYYSVAIAYLPSRIKSFFRQNFSNRIIDEKNKARSPYYLSIILGILFLIGASVPIAEKLGQAGDYNNYSAEATTTLSDGGVFPPSAISAFLEEDRAVLVSGIALYPRFVRRNSRVHLAEMPRGYEYLHLWLINEEDRQVILPLQESPRDIPHTAIISVIGCQEKNYISALAIIVHEPSSQIIARDPGVALTCPFPEPDSD